MERTPYIRQQVWRSEEKKAERTARNREQTKSVEPRPIRSLSVFPVYDLTPDPMREAALESICGELEDSGVSVERLPEGKSDIRSSAQVIAASDGVYLPILGDGVLNTRILLILALARFYGKPVVVHLLNQEHPFESANSKLMFRLLEQAPNRILVARAGEDAKRNGKLKEVGFIAPNVSDLSAIASVQPRIATVVTNDSTHALTVLLKSYSIVKQKYPRAELLIVKGEDDSSLDASIDDLTLPAGVSIVEFDQIRLYRDKPVEADLVIDLSSLGKNRTPLISALAEGLPVISYQQPGTIPLIAHELEGIVISRLDFSQIANIVLAMIESPDEVARKSREALRASRGHSAGHFVAHLREILSSSRE